jgi:threonine dehydratase
MLEDQSDLDVVIVPLGGGGLLSGSAIVARALGGRTRVFGAEVEASPVFTGALAAGRITPVEIHPTLADGLAGNMEPDSRTFDLVRTLADGVALVKEASLALAMRDLIRREQLIVEGAGAAGVAAVLQGAVDVTGKRVGVVLSGRNVDAHVIAKLMG